MCFSRSRETQTSLEQPASVVVSQTDGGDVGYTKRIFIGDETQTKTNQLGFTNEEGNTIANKGTQTVSDKDSQTEPNHNQDEPKKGQVDKLNDILDKARHAVKSRCDFHL